MRVLPSEVVSYLNQRESILTHVLVHIEAKDSEGQPATIGFWTGDDHIVATTDGVERTYYGANSVISMDPFTQRSALEVREHSIVLNPLTDEVISAIKIYDAYLAPVLVHEWYFNPTIGLPISQPVRILKGVLAEVTITEPPDGGDATCALTIVSAAWELTRTLSLRRSQEALEARSPTDALRQYNSISGAVPTAWGEKIKETQ